ncbi:MAG: NIPSNAP family containing protein, partial [Verrucomicrobia bacterium]|nr:NIPSNAP family containing protein [Verrucomicrobiota bacterium]NDB74720.1 NIPSNAP family containing protein [Verrucomicrobiota bacterium]
TFRADPEWLKLKAVPEYADKEIVLKVTNRLLTPTPYSEL